MHDLLNVDVLICGAWGSERSGSNTTNKMKLNIITGFLLLVKLARFVDCLVQCTRSDFECTLYVIERKEIAVNDLLIQRVAALHWPLRELGQRLKSLNRRFYHNISMRAVAMAVERYSRKQQQQQAYRSDGTVAAAAAILSGNFSLSRVSMPFRLSAREPRDAESHSGIIGGQGMPKATKGSAIGSQTRDLIGSVSVAEANAL